MTIQYSPFDLLIYLMLYSFLAWTVEVSCIAIKNRSFVNSGLLNLPLKLPHGISVVVLLLVLPTLENNFILQYLLTWIVMCIIWKFTELFMKSLSCRCGIAYRREGSGNTPKNILISMLVAGIYLVVYLVVHPVIFGVVEILPKWIEAVIAITFVLLVTVDYVSVRYTLRTSRKAKGTEHRKEDTQRLADKIADGIWNRLQKAYPGIKEVKNTTNTEYVFAQGICFDKLVWIFLISAFLGDIIEMVFCRVTSGRWMSRSSLLYGMFSCVWGLGAVVLTVVLQRLEENPNRKIFMAGFVVGGAYEYLCSVFTEIVFGTVFWDYSHMPLNIGGRTNVLYCVFWGLLAVLWIKLLYPLMEKRIEKMPPLAGKILTWAIVLVMTCNGVLTAGAMVRYTQRQSHPEPRNVVEQFIDSRYDDEWMENRWPNMVIPEADSQQ